MDQIVVDETFTRQLPGANAPCIVLDAAGKRLGYFTPEVDRAWYQGLEPSVSDDELKRREQAGGGRSLAEILADLQQRH
ncbi:MAG: hypothetical protein L0219_06390 [Phycisphaerales bacterium]|nr:hypothetical protein [Phycisphaerales bacterium]